MPSKIPDEISSIFDFRVATKPKQATMFLQAYSPGPHGALFLTGSMSLCACLDVLTWPTRHPVAATFERREQVAPVQL
ncbi:MAG: hypothetical protein LBU07_06310 [Coriobacteriales bacterium]|jgi:hypothetical protein|nr:hypothetical protein [Coriobacteriales bacterium]